MRIHPVLHINAAGDITLKNGSVVKPTSVTLHNKNLKASGWFSSKFNSLRKKVAGMDKQKFIQNLTRTHGTIKGLLGGRQKGSTRVAQVSGLSSDRKEMAHFAQAAYS